MIGKTYLGAIYIASLPAPLIPPCVLDLRCERQVQDKLLRAGGFAVEGAKRAAPLLSLPWALGVRAVAPWSGNGAWRVRWDRLMPSIDV